MFHDGKMYLRVSTVKLHKTQRKKKDNSEWKMRVNQEKAGRYIHKEIEGEFSNLDVNPRTIEDVVELQDPNLSVLEIKKQKSKKKFIKKEK